jgi:hypothetical protein
VVGKIELNEMCSDDLAHGISVNETSKEDKGYEMVVQDFRVEVEIHRDESPGRKEWDESYKGISRFVAGCATCLYYVLATSKSAFP